MVIGQGLFLNEEQVKMISLKLDRSQKKKLFLSGLLEINKDIINKQLKQNKSKKNSVICIENVDKKIKTILTFIHNSGRWVLKRISVFEQKRKIWVCSFVLATCLFCTGGGFSVAFKDQQFIEVVQLRGGVLPGASGLPVTPVKTMSPHGQPRVNRGVFSSPLTPKHVPGTNIGSYNSNGTLRSGGSNTSKPPGVTGQSGRAATGLSAQNDNKEAINLRENIKDSLLTRQSKKAYNNEDVKRGIEELESKLERGIEQPGLGSKTVAKGIKEHRHKNGGRTYIKRKDETIYEVVARSGKRKSDQTAVINRLKEIYGD